MPRHPRFRALFLLPFAVGVLAAAPRAFAQDAAGTSFLELHPELHPVGLISTILYGIVGIALALLGYKVFDWITPFSLTKEIEEDQNPAAGLVVGAIIIGTSIIVAAAIH